VRKILVCHKLKSSIEELYCGKLSFSLSQTSFSLSQAQTGLQQSKLDLSKLKLVFDKLKLSLPQYNSSIELFSLWQTKIFLSVVFKLCFYQKAAVLSHLIPSKQQLPYLPQSKLMNSETVQNPINNLQLPFSGTIRSLHHSQHSCTLRRMCFPGLHVIDAAAQFNNFLYALHELLHSKLFKEKVTGDEKSGVKSFVIEIVLVLALVSRERECS
jgi:hypothetical protein